MTCLFSSTASWNQPFACISNAHGGLAKCYVGASLVSLYIKSNSWCSLQVIGWFWEVVHEFTAAQKKQLLMFVTGSTGVHVEGLASLPPFVICRNGPASERLPRAHTCFNHLFLPAYQACLTSQASENCWSL